MIMSDGVRCVSVCLSQLISLYANLTVCRLCLSLAHSLDFVADTQKRKSLFSSKKEPAAAISPERASAAHGAAASVVHTEAAATTASASGPTRDQVKAALAGKQVVFVLGGPGSGKGTQCARLVEKYGFTHISAGDLLRLEVQSGSARGKEIDDIMKRGDLVPMETIVLLLRDAMLKEPQSTGYLIDGFPREMSQALEFERSVAECDFVLAFECSEETMEKRLLKRGETSGRADDNAESIKKRFKTFVEKSKPVIDHYASVGKVRLISSEDDPETVFANTCAVVDASRK
jgi:adenylate kinase